MLFDWNDEGGPNAPLQRLVPSLIGRRVVSASASAPTWDLRIEFSGDRVLEVFSDCSDDRDDAWFVLGTDGIEVSVSPEMDEASQQ